MITEHEFALHLIRDATAIPNSLVVQGMKDFHFNAGDMCSDIIDSEFEDTNQVELKALLGLWVILAGALAAAFAAALVQWSWAHVAPAKQV